MTQRKNKIELDQHLLTDDSVVNQMISSSKLCIEDVVLEIGPGKGMITMKLAKKVKKVVAVELDEKFKPYLNKLPKNVQVIYENVFKIMKNLNFNKIVSNIPFSISEPLIKYIIKSNNVELAILIVPKHFFKILVEKSKWSTIVPLFFNIEMISELPKKTFDPQPQVDTAIIRLEKRTSNLTETEKILKEFILLDNKKTKNALMEALIKTKKMNKRIAKEIIDKLHISHATLEVDTELLSNEQFEEIKNGIFHLDMIET